MDGLVKFHSQISWPLFLEERVAGITHNFQNPSARISPLVAAKELECAKVSLLDHVLRIVHVSNEPAREVVRRIQMRHCDLFKTPGITGPTRRFLHPGIRLSR